MQTSSPPPVRETDLAKFGDAQKTIEKLKTQQSPLDPDDQKKLDAAEHSVASTIEYNLQRKKAVIEKRGGTLHPTEAGALKKAQDTLSRLEPERGNVQPGNGAGNDSATPAAPQPQNSASGPRLQFSQGSTNSRPTADSDIVMPTAFSHRRKMPSSLERASRTLPASHLLTLSLS